MLIESSTGLDLNAPEDELRGIDILWDVPKVITVARLRFAHGTRYEIAHCPKNSDYTDMNIARNMVPQGNIRLRGYPSSTLGCDCDDEHTYAFWVFE